MPIPLPLDPSKTYSLEDLHNLNRAALHSLASLFGAAYWLNNLPHLLREQIFNIPNFNYRFQALTPLQQEILTFFSQYPGQPVLCSDFYDYFERKAAKASLDNAISDLTEQGWFIEGNTPSSWLVTQEICRVLSVVKPFQQFLLADLPPETPAGAAGKEWLTDLIELSAFLSVEQPTLTNKGMINKQALRRLMPRLRPIATTDWEEALMENRYTELFSCLLSMLTQVGVIQIVHLAEKPYYRFNQDHWCNFLSLPAAQRLLQVVILWLIDVNSRQHNQLISLFSLLPAARSADGHWLSGAKLLAGFSDSNSSSQAIGRDPFAEEFWLQETLLDPLLYLGLMEQTRAELPTPWSKNPTAHRTLWRLTPSGAALAEWLAKYDSSPAAYQQLTSVSFVDGQFPSPISTMLEQWTLLLPPETAKELILQPDLSFIAPRTTHPFLLWILSVYGETTVQDYVYQGSFSRASILKALKANMLMEELTSTLADHCKIPPTDTVWQTLAGWSSAYDRTLLAHALLLACETPEMATEIAAQTKLAKHILGQLGPQVLLLDPRGEGVIRKWLDKKNWIPRPNIASATLLQQWLSK